MNTDFNTAIHLLRGGEVEKGLEMLEQSDLSTAKKNIAKAEIAYFQDDLKNAMYLDEHALTSDNQWYDPLIVNFHLRAYVRAALTTDSVSRAKEFLDYYISEKRSEYDVVGIKPFNSLYYNAMNRLDGIKASDSPQSVKILTKETAKSSAEFFTNGLDEQSVAKVVSLALFSMWNEVETDFVLSTYEKYADYLEHEDHHYWAARNYIKLKNPELAEKAVMRCVKAWNPTENFTVLPMKFFVFKDITKFLTPEIKLKILTTDKNKE